MSTQYKSNITELPADRVYLYKIRVLRYLNGLDEGSASRASITRKLLTNIKRETRDALVDDMLRQQLISSSAVYNPDSNRRPRTFYTLLAKGRTMYLRHRHKCKTGKMRKLIPGAKP